MTNKKTIGEIKKICKDFIVALGDDATEESVFPLLVGMAEQYGLTIQAQQYGLTIQAQQRGISGTYICFIKTRE